VLEAAKPDEVANADDAAKPVDAAAAALAAIYYNLSL
jgi:hypothetical protein